MQNLLNKKFIKKESLQIFSKYMLLVLWCFFVIVPILVVVFTSFKTDDEYVRTNVFTLPESFLNFENFKTAFIDGNFAIAFKNSIFLSGVASVGNIILGTMVAYCLSRFDFRLNRYIKSIYIFSAMIPSVTLQVSIYQIMKNLDLINTMYAPFILYVSTDIVQIWLYLQYLDKIPFSLDESAMIEGSSYFRIFRSIIFPLLIPAHMTVFILKFVTIYNDMFVQHLYLQTPELRTVTTALMTFSGDRINAQNLMSAAIFMVMIPTVVIFLILQKYILNGITVGAIKE